MTTLVVLWIGVAITLAVWAAVVGVLRGGGD